MLGADVHGNAYWFSAWYCTESGKKMLDKSAPEGPPGAVAAIRTTDCEPFPLPSPLFSPENLDKIGLCLLSSTLCDSLAHRWQEPAGADPVPFSP